MTMIAAAPLTASAATTINATNTAALDAANKNVVFTGENINLTLDGMYKKLENSPTMAQLELQKKTDQSVAQGAIEKASDYIQLEDAVETYGALAGAAYWTYDSSSSKMLRRMRTFATAMVEPNHEARVGKFQREAYEQYFTLRNLEETARIAKDNMDVTKAIADSVAKKFDRGTASKLEVLSAQTDLNTATDNYAKALAGLNQMRMAFNLYCGYDLMQKVTLTDKVDSVELPKVTLDEAIASALANRLEITGAAYNLDMAELSFNSVKDYPSNSATYIKGQYQVSGAALAYAMEPDVIRIDVTGKYQDMMQAYQEVQSGKVSAENAKETARLVQLQYNSGYCTLTAVQQAQLGSYSAQLNLANAMLKFNLAVRDFELCQGVGTAGVPLVS